MSARAKTTTERGLGWQHQKQRTRLLARHKDGTPCPCLDDDACGPACLCRPVGVGLPMHKDPERNADGMPLEADHTLARSLGGKVADRLLLATCNRSRQDGTRVPGLDTDLTTTPSWWSRTWYPVAQQAGTPPTSPQAAAPAPPTRPTPTTPGPTTPGPGTTSPQPTGRRVVLLTGPPGSGKTTLAHTSGLPVYDQDDPQWTGDRAFRDAIATLAHDPHAQAVVIRSCPTSQSRAQMATLIGATHTYLVTAPKRECEQRVARRGRPDTRNGLIAVGRWFATHDRDDDVPPFTGWTGIVDNSVENPGPGA